MAFFRDREPWACLVAPGLPSRPVPRAHSQTQPTSCPSDLGEVRRSLQSGGAGEPPRAEAAPGAKHKAGGPCEAARLSGRTDRGPEDKGRWPPGSGVATCIWRLRAGMWGSLASRAQGSTPRRAGLEVRPPGAAWSHRGLRAGGATWGFSSHPSADGSAPPRVTSSLAPGLQSLPGSIQCLSLLGVLNFGSGSDFCAASESPGDSL